MSYAGIQSFASRNCRPGLAWSNPVSSGTVSASATNAVTSASQRAACARRSPSIRASTPPSIGSQINRLNRGAFATSSIPCKGWARASGPELSDHHQQRDQTDDHREGVVVQVTGLDAAHDARHEADQARAAVDRDAVDQLAVDRARGLAHDDAAAGETVDPQIVHVVLALQHA